MDCNRCKELLAEYVLGELDAATRHEVDDALATCADCRAELALQQRLLDAAAGLPQLSFDPARRAAVMAEATQFASARRASDVAWYRHPAFAMAAIALLALGGTFAALAGRPGADSAPTSDTVAQLDAPRVPDHEAAEETGAPRGPTAPTSAQPTSAQPSAPPPGPADAPIAPAQAAAPPAEPPAPDRAQPAVAGNLQAQASRESEEGATRSAPVAADPAPQRPADGAATATSMSGMGVLGGNTGPMAERVASGGGGAAPTTGMSAAGMSAAGMSATGMSATTVPVAPAPAPVAAAAPAPPSAAPVTSTVAPSAPPVAATDSATSTTREAVAEEQDVIADRAEEVAVGYGGAHNAAAARAESTSPARRDQADRGRAARDRAPQAVNDEVSAPAPSAAPYAGPGSSGDASLSAAEAYPTYDWSEQLDAGIALYRSARYAEAAALLEEYVAGVGAGDPRAGDAQFHLGAALWSLGETRRAAQILGDYLVEFPSHAQRGRAREILDAIEAESGSPAAEPAAPR